MSEFLRVRIDFTLRRDQGDLTPRMISDSLRAIFEDAGLSENVVSRGVEKVNLKKAAPLGIDPGTAAVLVAMIGMAVELIKLGFELERQGEELAIKKREIALKEEELRARQKPEKETDDELKLIEEFVNKVLLVKLMEQHNIQPTSVHIQIEER